jgi:hypothetical protein
MGTALIRIWNNIPQTFFNTLIRLMHRRCQACINANGGHTLLTLLIFKQTIVFKTPTQ